MSEEIKLDTKFKPGNKMGKGRPLGVKNKSTNVINIIGKEMDHDIVMTIAKQALAGDLTAARMILDCNHGRAKTRSFINLGHEFETNTLEEIKDLMSELIKNMCSGELAIDDVMDIAKILENKAELNLTAAFDIEDQDYQRDLLQSKS